MKSIQQYLFEVSDETLRSAISKADAKIADKSINNSDRRKLRQQKEEFEKYLKSPERAERMRKYDYATAKTLKPADRNELIDMVAACVNAGKTDLNHIDTSNVTSLERFYDRVSLLVNDLKTLDKVDISKWDVSNVVRMDYAFVTWKTFNCDLSKWDVSNVKSTHGMFCQCESFNCDLSKWDVSKCTDMSNMFQMCDKFNSDLSKWDVSKCTDMTAMFFDCGSFNSDLSKWDVSKCTMMASMFAHSESFDSDLSNWNLHYNVHGLKDAFKDCPKMDDSKKPVSPRLKARPE